MSAKIFLKVIPAPRDMPEPISFSFEYPTLRKTLSKTLCSRPSLAITGLSMDLSIPEEIIRVSFRSFRLAPPLKVIGKSSFLLINFVPLPMLESPKPKLSPSYPVSKRSPTSKHAVFAVLSSSFSWISLNDAPTNKSGLTSLP